MSPLLGLDDETADLVERMAGFRGVADVRVLLEALAEDWRNYFLAIRV